MSKTLRESLDQIDSSISIQNEEILRISSSRDDENLILEQKSCSFGESLNNQKLYIKNKRQSLDDHIESFNNLKKQKASIINSVSEKLEKARRNVSIIMKFDDDTYQNGVQKVFIDPGFVVPALAAKLISDFTINPKCFSFREDATQALELICTLKKDTECHL